MKKYAVYTRVSTKKQGTSGLGLESQQKICADFIKANGGIKAAEFSDVESGTHRDRKGLLAAIDYCKRNDTALVIAKLDRLARDVEFCFRVVNTGIEIHFCDMPNINTLLLGVFAAVAQYERELTSDRTKKALDAKKLRGEKTGGATDAWRKAYESKTAAKIKAEADSRADVKKAHYQESRDVQAFKKVVMKVFPDYTCSDNPAKWNWCRISCRSKFKMEMLALMKDYKDFDPQLFKRWDFSQDNAQKLRSYMQSFKRSFTTN